MLVNETDPRWCYTEIPRTGSTTIDRGLRKTFPAAKAPFAKHWPVVPLAGYISLVSIRNPYSRAVSCWSFFTQPGVSFSDWLRRVETNGFCDIDIEARPQSYWYRLAEWDYVIRQESLDSDLWQALQSFASEFDIPTQFRRLNDSNDGWRNRVGVCKGRSRPWQAYYDLECVALVRKLYAEDFDALAAFYSTQFPE